MENVKELAIDKVLECSFLLSLFHRVETGKPQGT